VKESLVALYTTLGTTGKEARNIKARKIHTSLGDGELGTGVGAGEGEGVGPPAIPLKNKSTGEKKEREQRFKRQGALRSITSRASISTQTGERKKKCHSAAKL